MNLNDATSRFLRTLLQLLAGGAFTALIEQVAQDVPTNYTPYILMISTLVVNAAQQAIEKNTGTMLLRPAKNATV